MVYQNPNLGDANFYVRGEIGHFSNTHFQFKATAAATVRVLPMINSRGIDR